MALAGLGAKSLLKDAAESIRRVPEGPGERWGQPGIADTRDSRMGGCPRDPA